MMTVALLDGANAPASLVICDETYGQEVITVIDTPISIYVGDVTRADLQAQC